MPHAPLAAASRSRWDADWLDTCRRHDDIALDWSERCPALDGCTRLDDVIDACRRDDLALVAVLARAQAGCPIAGRCVLQAVRPLLARLARRDPGHDLDDYLGACWPVAMRFHPEPGSRALVTLALNTRKSLVRERPDLWVLTDVDPADHPVEPPVTTADIVRISRRLHLVPSTSADVLVSVYGDGLTGKQAAAVHGMSHDMVRYRCSSAVRALRAHRLDLLENLPV